MLGARKKAPTCGALSSISGGSGEIRTHEQFNPSPVFKTGAFNRSATLPAGGYYTEITVDGLGYPDHCRLARVEVHHDGMGFAFPPADQQRTSKRTIQSKQYKTTHS